MIGYQQEFLFLEVHQLLLKKKAPDKKLNNQIDFALDRIRYYNSVRDFSVGYSFEEQQAIFEEQGMFDEMLPLLICKVANACENLPT